MPQLQDGSDSIRSRNVSRQVDIDKKKGKMSHKGLSLVFRTKPVMREESCPRPFGMLTKFLPKGDNFVRTAKASCGLNDLLRRAYRSLVSS